MGTFDLRIFSYLPNPRIWKATIAARMCGVTIDIRGAAGSELQKWLWDFEARPLSDAEMAEAKENERLAKAGFSGPLFKTNAFLDAHPFGTVPAAFGPDGTVGIFESNSIMRAVGRLGQEVYPLYGKDPYAASRIDSFLDASLVFARDSQVYLLALMAGTVTPEVHARAKEAFATYLTGIDRALMPSRSHLVGDGITLADICFVAEYALFSNERAQRKLLEGQGLEPVLNEGVGHEYSRALNHFQVMSQHEAFAEDVAPYMEKLERRIERAA